jgi:4-amino-4-deoxy-L-arabinose transferase-like glycosyltransferase
MLIGWLISRLSSAADGRAALVLLQLMPVAFIFRIRANHEYPMLFALALTLAGLCMVARSWRGVPLVAIGLTVGLLVKGVFVLLPLAGAGLWILINPTREPGARGRGIVALAAGMAVMTGVAALYDVQYVRVTGHSFWTAYLNRQIAPLDLATPVEGQTMLAHNLAFYISRLLWHPAPWSFALVAIGWSQRRRLREFRPLPSDTALRGLALALSFAIAAVVILMPSNRFAERYVFSATYAIGAAGVVIAFHRWTSVRRGVERLDAAIPALPAVTWLVLMLLRLVLGPLLPRI